MTNQTALLMGHLLGKKIVGMRTSRKLVGYKLGTLALPPVVPAWDAKKYPYVYQSGSAIASLYLCSAPVTHVEEDAAFKLVGDVPYSYLRYGAVANASTEWKLYETVENATEDKLMSFDQQNTAVEIVWTNTDMVRTDGTIFLAASDPVPVYE